MQVSNIILDMLSAYTVQLISLLLNDEYFFNFKRLFMDYSMFTRPRGNCNLNCRLETGHFEKTHFPCSELLRLDLTHLRQNYINLGCQKMSLIQSKKFRTCETGLFKIPRLEMSHLQMAVEVTVASGHSLFQIGTLRNKKPRDVSNGNKSQGNACP